MTLTTSDINLSATAREWMALTAYTLAAYACVYWGYASGLTAKSLILIWPAAGICSWVAVRYGWKCVPVVFLSHQIHSFFLSPEYHGGMHLAVNLCNAVGYFVVTLIYQRLGGTHNIFDSLRQTLLFIFSFALGMSFITGASASLFYLHFLDLPFSHYGPLLWRWTLSDFSGVVLVAPAFFALFKFRNEGWRNRLRNIVSEGGLSILAAVAVMCGIGALALLKPNGLGQFPTILLIMPLCIWLALSDKPRSSLVLLTATIMATMFIMLNANGAASEARYFAVQPYAVMLMLTCLVIRASNTERNVALEALSAERAQLEVNVDKRTKELHEALKDVQRSALEQEKMAEELRLAQRLESIGQLAAGIAHEINTPSQFVRDNLVFLKTANFDQQLLLSKCMSAVSELADPEKDAELLADIETVKNDIDFEFLEEELSSSITESIDGIKQISKIVSSMKDFSHPGQTNKQSMDINHSIEAAMAVAKNEWKLFASIETSFDPKLPAIMAYASELNQVLLNMIVNSAHAIETRLSDPDSIEPGTIHIGTSVVDDQIEVRIRDNGCGIPKETIDRIFDPFFTTKQVGKGTGQGLTIAHRIIVERHNGSIKLSSELGKFTEFRVYLPLNDAEAADTLGSQSSAA
ncbi:MAG: ATP-binding protein [Gammaproteobacteria bacterium]